MDPNGFVPPDESLLRSFTSCVSQSTPPSRALTNLALPMSRQSV